MTDRIDSAQQFYKVCMYHEAVGFGSPPSFVAAKIE